MITSVKLESETEMVSQLLPRMPLTFYQPAVVAQSIIFDMMPRRSRSRKSTYKFFKNLKTIKKCKSILNSVIEEDWEDDSDFEPVEDPFTLEERTV